MKIKEIGSKLGKKIGTWHVGDYIRQFSIVVAGIVVTFTGSDIISNHAKQQEVKAVMELVQSELQHNREQLSEVKYKLDSERKMASMLVYNDFDYSKIPRDTLSAYQSLFTRLGSFRYTKDALEILKNSSLMQQVSDKSFLLSVIQSYEALREIEEDVDGYYALKKENIFPVLNRINDADRKLMQHGDMTVSYRYFLSTPESRNGVSTIPNFFNPGVFDNADRMLKQSIEGIRERYK